MTKSKPKAKPEPKPKAKPRPKLKPVPKPKSSKPTERIVERLRAICLALPEANERISHGEPTWFAGKGKVFAMFDNLHHGAEHASVWLPQPLGIQEMLIEADPKRYFKPPYVGVRGWLGVVLDTAPDWSSVEQLVRDAYVHVASRTLVAKLPAPNETTSGRSRRLRPASALRPARDDRRGSH